MTNLKILNNLKDLRKLRSLYKKNYYNNNNVVGYHALNNFVKWFENEPDIKHITVYTLDNEWQQTGIYLIVDRYSLFLNSLIPNDDNLRTAIKLLDWSRGYKITALPVQHHEIVADTLKELNIEWREVNLHVYRLPWQKAVNFNIDCPLDFEVRPLDLKAAPIIDAHFHSQQAGSLYFFERLLKNNLSVGVFDCNNDELVAWCTRCHNGFLSSLFVKPNYRRRGFAELITKIFANQLAKLQTPEDTFAAAYIHNPSSNPLFIKLDFDIITSIYHMIAFCVPKGCEWTLD